MRHLFLFLKHFLESEGNISFILPVVIEDGRVFSFGQGDGGQLGHGDRASIFTPKIIEINGVKIQKVACGSEHVAAVSGR